MIRIGHGYDVHRLVNGRKLILGGVEIPYEKGLDGHSDADVLLHAICDAIIGALSLGDIGKLYPDSDDKFLNINSRILLKDVAKRMAEAGYIMGNVDATVIVQSPKLSPYIDQMRKNISEDLSTNEQNVNVKATTEEHLGFTGRSEGISAHAVCIIVKK